MNKNYIKPLYGFIALLVLLAGVVATTTITNNQITTTGDLTVSGDTELSGNTTTKILDKVHNVLGYGAIGDGSNDDTSAIQSAINAADSNNEIVYFPVGTYKITSALDVKAGVDITCQRGARIEVTGDINGLELTNDHTIQDCKIWTNTADYSKSIILMDEPWSGTERIKINGVQIRNYYNYDGTYMGLNGTALHFLNDDNGDKSVWGEFVDLNIRGFEYGIKMDCIAPDNNSYINANQFRGIMGAGTRYFIYINNSERNDITANWFEFQYQSESGTINPIYDDGGYYNFFKAYIWDFAVKTNSTVVYNFSSNSYNEYLIGNEMTRILDSGRENNYYDYTDGSFFSPTEFESNVSVKSNSGNTGLWVTRTGGFDQALKMYITDDDVVFQSIQDETGTGREGGFTFLMDTDAKPQYIIQVDSIIYRLNETGIYSSLDLYMNTNDIFNAGAITATTLNTGQGAYELYAMNQNVQTTSKPLFNGLDLSGSINMTRSGTPSIELRSTNGGTPLIDFSNDSITDYDIRLVLSSDNLLALTGGDFKINGDLNVTGVSSGAYNKAVCVKSDGNLGTCTNAVNATGYCTCS